MKKHLLILLTTIGLTLPVHGQPHIQPIFHTMLDTALLNQNSPFIVLLQNTGNSTFNGNIHVFASSGGFTFAVDSGIQVMNPGDTATFNSNQNFTYSAPYFSPGNNIVVIWPILYGTSGSSTDSLTDSVYIIDPMGIQSTAQAMVNCYPKMVRKGSLLACEEGFEDVRLLDMSGRVIAIRREGGNQFRVPSEISQGVYLLVTTNGQVLRREKIVVTD